MPETPEITTGWSAYLRLKSMIGKFARTMPHTQALYVLAWKYPSNIEIVIYFIIRIFAMVVAQSRRVEINVGGSWSSQGTQVIEMVPHTIPKLFCTLFPRLKIFF